MPSIRSSRPRLWALVDCNNFYASCEKLFRPDLADSPVVVLSNNDGMVIARSPEAKKLGINMGAVEFKIRRFLREHNVSIFSSNFALYGDISNRVMRVMEAVCPRVEQYSIDEAFLPLDDVLAAQAEEVASSLRETIRQWTGITVGVGVGPTRTLAKVANHIAKKGAGVHIMRGPDPAVLRQFPVSDIWGIGRRLTHKLYAAGIASAQSLAEASDVWLRKELTVTGWRTAMELRGIQCMGMDDTPVPRKSLLQSRSFGTKITDAATLARVVAAFTARAAERLRAEHLATRGIAVRIASSPFVHGPQHDATAQALFPTGTADTRMLQTAAERIFRDIFKQGPAYCRAGVMFFDLVPAGRQQFSLLPCHEDSPKSQALMAALDAVNRKHGRRSLVFGRQGLDSSAWDMRQEHRSPKFTSCWDELPIAFCR